MIGDYSDRYGSHFVKLIDSRVTMREFEFDQIILMPTAEGYRALVEQAKIEIKPKVMRYLSIAFCNLRCARRKETGGGCLAAVNKEQHHLPKCIKLPRDIAAGWGYVKRYIATGGAVCAHGTIGLQGSMGVKACPGSDFAPATSC